MRLAFSSGRFVFLLCSAPSELGLPLLWSLGCLPPPSLFFSVLVFHSPRAPLVSFFLCFPAPGALGLGALFVFPPSPPALGFFFSFLLLRSTPLLSLASCFFRPRVPWALALCAVCFVCLPLLGSLCALASFVVPAWPLAASWWLLPPPPPPFCVSRFSSLPLCAPVCFLFSLCAPVVSGLLRFRAPAALGLGAVCCLFCWPPASRLSVRSRLFCVSRLALGCSLVVAAPPPPRSVSRFSSLPLGPPFFFLVVRPPCLWLSLVSGPGCPEPWRCVLFVLLAPRFPALCALSPFWVSCQAVGCSMMVAAPPPPLCVSRFSLLLLSALFFSLLLVGGSRRLLPPPPVHAWCLVLSSVAALRCHSLLCAVLWCLALLWCGLLRAGRCLLGCFFVCCAALLVAAACGALSLVVLYGWFVRGVACCLVLVCVSVCRAVLCGPGCAALLRIVPPGVVLLCAVLFCCACLVSLLVVPCSLALPVALGPCALRRCVLRCSTALCALCCVCFVVACWCVLLSAAVLCAVSVLGCRAVRSLSSPLCAVLCSVLLVCLHRAVRVVSAVAGTWCCGALLCVVLFPLVFCGVVLGLTARGCLLVVFLGVGVPVWPCGLLPCGWCGLLWCPASLCRVLWCCAVAWCSAVVLCCRFAVLFVLASPSCGLSCRAVLCCWLSVLFCARCWFLCAVGPFPSPPARTKTLIMTLCYPAPVSASLSNIAEERGLAVRRFVADPRGCLCWSRLVLSLRACSDTEGKNGEGGADKGSGGTWRKEHKARGREFRGVAS